jgi:hypothetical protein
VPSSACGRWPTWHIKDSSNIEHVQRVSAKG